MLTSPTSTSAAGAGAIRGRCVVSRSPTDEPLRKRKRDEALANSRQPEDGTTPSTTSSKRAGRKIRCGIPLPIEVKRDFDWYVKVAMSASGHASNPTDAGEPRAKRPKSEPKATKPKREAKKGRKARLRGPDGRFVKRATIKSEAHEDKAGEDKPSRIVRS